MKFTIETKPKETNVFGKLLEINSNGTIIYGIVINNIKDSEYVNYVHMIRIDPVEMNIDEDENIIEYNGGLYIVYTDLIMTCSLNSSNVILDNVIIPEGLILNIKEELHTTLQNIIINIYGDLSEEDVCEEESIHPIVENKELLHPIIEEYPNKPLLKDCNNPPERIDILFILEHSRICKDTFYMEEAENERISFYTIYPYYNSGYKNTATKYDDVEPLKIYKSFIENVSKDNNDMDEYQNFFINNIHTLEYAIRNKVVKNYTDLEKVLYLMANDEYLRTINNRILKVNTMVRKLRFEKELMGNK